MIRPERKLVNARILELAKETANAMMQRDHYLKRMWMDQVATSAASDAAGGIVKLDTDNDWPLAFFTWLHAGKVIREP